MLQVIAIQRLPQSSQRKTVPWFYLLRAQVLNPNYIQLRPLPLIPPKYPLRVKSVTTLEQRKAKRFELKLPVAVTRAGSESQQQCGETMNVSSGGILLSGEVDVPVGQAIEYYISLPTGEKSGDVRLRCMGIVLRKDDDEGTLAASLERYEFVRAS